MSTPLVGTRVRAKCSATGTYMGEGMVLFVSAMDNDLAIDHYDPDHAPWENAPMPSSAEVFAAAMAYRRGWREASTRSQRLLLLAR